MPKNIGLVWTVVLRAITIAFLDFGYIVESHAASFECSKAGGTVETLVCSDQELSRLDEQLSVVYSRDLETSKAPEQLKATQRRWIRDTRNTCKDAPCIKAVYEDRLRRLESDAGGFDQTPDHVLMRELCEQLALEPSRERILAQQNGIEDINNDGRPETAKTCWGGTMQIPCTDYFGSDGNKIAIVPVGFEWNDYWTYGIRSFRYAGRTFFLHSKDDNLQELSHVSYITPKNQEHVLCEYNNSVVSVVDSQSNDADGVCEAVLQSSVRINALVLSDVPEQFIDLGERFGTSVNGVGTIDIANDGKQERVLELSYESLAGRICTINYYELLDSAGKKLSPDRKRIQFLDMQRVDESGPTERGCGSIVNRLFRYKNKTYFEHNLGSNQNAEHTVSILRGKSAEVACTFRREVKTQLLGVH